MRGILSFFVRLTAVYSDRRILVILLLGFSSGLPLALTGSTLTRWLAEGGIDRTTAGLFTLVTLPYALKFFWAPLIDRLKLPVLGEVFGRRRSWALLAQTALALAIAGLGLTDPATGLSWTALCSFVVAFCSASQDVVVDAYRIERLEEKQQAAGAAIYVLGYRVGMLASGAGALYLAETMGWRTAYFAMAALVSIGFLTILAAPEPGGKTSPDFSVKPGASKVETVRAWLHDAVEVPFTQFMRRPNWITILAFIALYKAGDVIAGPMLQFLYLHLDFTKIEIAWVTKVFGLCASIAGGLIGGVLVSRAGILRGLMIGGILQMASLTGYGIVSLVGHDVPTLACVIAVDNICAGIATAAFVAYLSSLCNVAHTATQYALLTSFFKIGGDMLGACSGKLSTFVSWHEFFMISVLACVPALFILTQLMKNSREAVDAAAET